MALKVQVSLILCLSFLLASSIVRAQVFNVKKYGAKADGKTDSSKAISDAWKAACASKKPSTVLIPKGKYMSGVVTMKGPCSSSMKFQIQGTLLAPTNPSAHHGLPNWITFQHVDEFTLFGGGVFDGQGQRAWSIGECQKRFGCKQLPINLRFDFINNGRVEGITSLNSKNFHINVIGCKNLTFEKVTITAPETSTNTDGIHIGRSHGVNIINTNIGTGDDCISLGDGSQEVRITGVKCGPGHGISVGSLGKYQNEEPVSGIYVNNCTLTKTTNGVRIKSWPAMYGGTASDMHFENIIMDRVGNPILIDQQYCPWNQCNKKASSKVKISKVSFKNIRGTSTTPEAIQLACSNGLPCEKVELSNINLAYSGPLGPAKFACSNVRPSMSGNLKPAGCKAT